MTPRLIPFEPSHARQIINRDTGEVEEEATEMLMAKAKTGPAYTMLAGEVIIGAGGVIITHPGNGFAWLDLTDEARGYPLWLTRIVEAVKWEAINKFHLHRIEALVVGNHWVNQRWLTKHFGFRCEGMKEQCTSDREDGLVFAWIAARGEEPWQS